MDTFISLDFCFTGLDPIASFRSQRWMGRLVAEALSGKPDNTPEGRRISLANLVCLGWPSLSLVQREGVIQDESCGTSMERRWMGFKLPLLQVVHRSIGRPGGVSSFAYRAFMGLSIYCVFARTTKTRGTAGALRARVPVSRLASVVVYVTEDEDNGNGNGDLDGGGGAGQHHDLPTVMMTRVQGRGDADAMATPGRIAASSAILLCRRRPSRPACTTMRIHRLSQPFWRLKKVFLCHGLQVAPPYAPTLNSGSSSSLSSIAASQPSATSRVSDIEARAWDLNFA
ncbi:hypothetical protein K438DRAFT_1982360 [Mycena galopus ATCC 62051]|nr:hypothetical protein K438DRAFT_1982360 [Mycena galopus ATCC 62051]